MTSIIPGDTYDPCTTYFELRAAYLDLLKGGGVKRVRFHNGEEQRETEFNSANLKDLKEAMNNAKAECEALNGGRPRRRAIGFGRPGPSTRGIY